MQISTTLLLACLKATLLLAARPDGPAAPADDGRGSINATDLIATNGVDTSVLLPRSDEANINTLANPHAKRDCWYGKSLGCSQTGWCYKTCGNQKGNWCWLAASGGRGPWLKCTEDSQCRPAGADCGQGNNCKDCGCSCH